MEQYLQRPATQNESIKDDINKRKSTSTGLSRGVENTSSGGFDCNICLDTVRDPVVTLCGHLYCWPCIYKWIHSQTGSSGHPDHPSQCCPVCKEGVSESTLIPLYGRELSSSSSDGKVVPRRPNRPRCGAHAVIAATTTTSSHPTHQVHHPYYLAEPPGFGFAGTTTFHPMIGMFGELISARMFRNSQATLYTYPNTYSTATTSSARVRRRMMQADRSLSRFVYTKDALLEPPHDVATMQRHTGLISGQAETEVGNAVQCKI